MATEQWNSHSYFLTTHLWIMRLTHINNTHDTTLCGWITYTWQHIMRLTHTRHQIMRLTTANVILARLLGLAVTMELRQTFLSPALRISQLLAQSLDKRYQNSTRGKKGTCFSGMTKRINNVQWFFRMLYISY